MVPLCRATPVHRNRLPMIVAGTERRHLIYIDLRNDKLTGFGGRDFVKLRRDHFAGTTLRRPKDDEDRQSGPVHDGIEDDLVLYGERLSEQLHFCAALAASKRLLQILIGRAIPWPLFGQDWIKPRTSQVRESLKFSKGQVGPNNGAFFPLRTFAAKRHTSDSAPG